MHSVSLSLHSFLLSVPSPILFIAVASDKKYESSPPPPPFPPFPPPPCVLPPPPAPPPLVLSPTFLLHVHWCSPPLTSVRFIPGGHEAGRGRGGGGKGPPHVGGGKRDLSHAGGGWRGGMWRLRKTIHSPLDLRGRLSFVQPQPVSTHNRWVRGGSVRYYSNTTGGLEEDLLGTTVMRQVG